MLQFIATNFQSVITNFQLIVPDFQFVIATFQFGFSNFQLIVTRKQLLILQLLSVYWFYDSTTLKPSFEICLYWGLDAPNTDLM